MPAPSETARLQQLEWHVGALDHHISVLDQSVRAIIGSTNDDQSRSVVLCSVAELVLDLARSQPAPDGDDDAAHDRAAERERRRA